MTASAINRRSGSPNRESHPQNGWLSRLNVARHRVRSKSGGSKFEIAGQLTCLVGLLIVAPLHGFGCFPRSKTISSLSEESYVFAPRNHQVKRCCCNFVLEPRDQSSQRSPRTSTAAGSKVRDH